MSIWDLHATILGSLGIDHTKRNLGPDGRPFRLVDDQNERPLAEAFA